MFVVDDCLDHVDEGKFRWKCLRFGKNRDLAIEREQLSRIAGSESMELAAAMRSRVHKKAPVTEFGARVQKEGGRQECLVPLF